MTTRQTRFPHGKPPTLNQRFAKSKALTEASGRDATRSCAAKSRLNQVIFKRGLKRSLPVDELSRLRAFRPDPGAAVIGWTATITYQLRVD
jgi:hypothetical protein